MLSVRFFKKVSVVLITLFVVACGGGGGSDGGGSNIGNNPPANTAPTVNAGTDQTVDEQTSVTLSGSATDSEGTIASYSWSQTAGTSVTLSDANTATASFTAPDVDADETLTFRLTATDNDNASASDTVNITVKRVNQAPTASAGEDQTVDENTLITLSGSGTDPDGTIASYSWTQTAGTSVTLSDANTATASFTAPDVDADETLTFELTITDDDGTNGSQLVNIVVHDLPESVTGKVQDTKTVVNVRLLAEDGKTELDSTITDNLGNYTLQTTEQHIAQNGHFIIEAILPLTQVPLRTQIKALDTQDQAFSSIATNISIFTEAAKLFAESEPTIEVAEYIKDILVYSDELQIHLPTKNSAINTLAETIQTYANSTEAVASSEYRNRLLLALIESKWPDTLQTNSNYSVGFNVADLLETSSIIVKSSDSISSVEVANNALVFDTVAPVNVKLTLDLFDNGELIYRTDLHAMVVEKSDPLVISVPLGEEVTLNNGNLTIQTSQNSFSSATELSVAEVTQLPDGYDDELENVFTISAGVQPENAVTLKWQVQDDTEAANTRLMFVDPATQETEVLHPVAYQPDNKQLTFEINHFSTYGFFNSESTYNLGTEFTMQMVEADPKGVFRFIRYDVLDQLDNEAAIKRLDKSCSFGHEEESEVCASYLERLSSKALHSFMLLADDVSNLEKLNGLSFRYNLFQLFNNSGLEEYVKQRGRVKSLAVVLANGEQYSVREPSIFPNSLDNGVADIYKYDDGFFYYIPMSAKRMAEVGETSSEQMLSNLKRTIEVSNLYQDEKLSICKAGEYLTEALRKAELAKVPLVPSSPLSEVLSQRDDFAVQWELLMKEDFTSMLKAEVGVGLESSSDDFLIPTISQILAELTPAKPLLEATGAYLALTKPVKNSLDLAEEQLTDYLRAAKYVFVKNAISSGCSDEHCLGATEKGNWVVYTFQGVERFIPRESFSLMSALDSWKQTFARCDFAESEYDGPGDTAVDDGSNNGSGGYQQGGGAPVQVVVNAAIQVSGNLEVGANITFDATDSTTTSGDLNYQWQLFKPSTSNAALASSSEPQVNFTPDKYGSYTVRLKVTANGVTAQTQYVFTVKEQGISKINNTGPQYVFGSASSGMAGNQGQQWEWSFEADLDVVEIVAWRVGGSRSDDGLGIALRRGSTPTIKCGGLNGNICNWDRTDYEGDVNGRRETIFVNNPASGTYHLKAYAFADFSENSIFFEIKKDMDKDNDGVPNTSDAFPLDPNDAYDSDGDGVGDNADAFPNDPAASVDADNDGQPDSWNSGYNEQSSITGLILDTALGVKSFVQDAGYVSVEGQIYILPQGEDTAEFILLDQASHGTVVMQEDKWLYTPNTGFTGADSFTYVVNDNGNVTQITVQLNVTDEYVPPPAPVYEQYAGFAISASTSAYGADHNTICASEFGNDWQIAEWNDIRAYYTNGGSLVTLVEKLGLETRNNAWLTRDGNISRNSTRDYFVSYHNYNKPANYDAHDNLDSYFLSLGSWTGTRPVMCSNLANNGGGAEPGQFDGSWTITGTADNPSAQCGNEVTASLTVSNGQADATYSSGNTTAYISGTLNENGLLDGEFSIAGGSVFGSIEGQFESTTAGGTYSWTSPACTGTWTATKHSPMVTSRKLNDTGITVSQANGDDAQYGRDALAAAGELTKVGGGNAGFDFTKIDTNGSELPESAINWSCVRDNNTGLIWEVKTDDGGLHDKDNEYAWYNPDDATNGGGRGNEDNGRNTHQYIADVDAQTLCGSKGWRLPTREELHSIVDYADYNPSIDTNYFPNTRSDWYYWSGSPDAKAAGSAWGVSFRFGEVRGNNKFGTRLVRLVRTGQ